MIEIKNRLTGEIIQSMALENLFRADLTEADLSGANLHRADLRGANLTSADLFRADLTRANLSWSDLSGADLTEADLSGANLHRADLSGADLTEANLSGANLTSADLEFWQFPSVRLLSSVSLGALSDELTVELMRRDAHAHPNPALFDAWATNGPCPYEKWEGVERFWLFAEKRELWSAGLPQMTDRDLIVAICQEKGWGIKGYLKIEK